MDIYNKRYKKYRYIHSDGTSEKVSYNMIKEHNEDIILDNVFYGLKHPSDYSDAEITEYENKARAENDRFLHELKKDVNGERPVFCPKCGTPKPQF